MITVTSAEAQSRFGELIDRSQREPVEVTRRGRVVAYVISSHDMQDLADVRKRREEAARWYRELPPASRGAGGGRYFDRRRRGRAKDTDKSCHAPCGPGRCGFIPRRCEFIRA